MSTSDSDEVSRRGSWLCIPRMSMHARLLLTRGAVCGSVRMADDRQVSQVIVRRMAKRLDATVLLLYVLLCSHISCQTCTVVGCRS
jgi:hypothetical protein